MMSGIRSLFFHFVSLILGLGTPQSFPPPLSAREERELFSAMKKTGDTTARAKLIEHNLRLVSHMVRKYYASYERPDELVSIGSLGLIKAVDTFNCDNGTRFATYAAKCIQNEILMLFRSQKKLSNEISINETIDMDRDGNPLTYMDIISSEDTIADDLDLKVHAEKLFSLLQGVLDEREHAVIILRYGLGDRPPMTHRDIAQKMHISRSYVSRIEKKALEKIERIELESLESGIEFKFPEPRRSGQVVANIENLCKSYGGNEVLKNVNLKIERGERIAIVGANGAGKTTLAKIMAGALGFDSGKVELGYNVDLSYFAQHQAAELNPENTVLEEAESSAPRGEKFKARGLLGSFLFSGDDVFKKVAVLSGGEKNRLALAKMLLRSFNFLILDEPTNHLDINSKKVLQRALSDYGGTFVIVSHDRDFLDGIVTKVVELGKRGVRAFPGNISDYIEKIRAEGAFDAPDSPKKPGEKALSYKEKKAIKSAQNREIGRIKRRIEKIESEILSNDSECEKLEAEMASPGFFKDAQNSRQVVERHSLLKKSAEGLYGEWQELAQALSELQNKAKDA